MTVYIWATGLGTFHLILNRQLPREGDPAQLATRIGFWSAEQAFEHAFKRGWEVGNWKEAS